MTISRFKWSGGVVAITVVTLAAVVGFMVPVFFVRAAPLAVRLIVVFSAWAVVAWLATWTPLWLSVGEDGVVLKKIVGRITIPADEIVSMRPVDKKVLDGSIRTFGSGGLFGFLGRFRNKALGNYTMYITEWRNLLMVETAERTYIFNYRGELPAAKS